jgi:prenyltransferase beta subunit
LLHRWKSIRGLFHTPSWPTLEDTYVSVAALDLIGALDRIDREACVRGILRRHRGQGFFDSPNSGGYNEYKISGGARDTFCAFETLRILGALDRVNDLDRWQFRTRKKSSADAVQLVTWEEVEAWACRERFEAFLRGRAENFADEQTVAKHL